MVGLQQPDLGLVKQFISSMNSYLGILKHYQTAKLREYVLQKKISAAWWKCFYATGRFRKLVRRGCEI
jgi:hypothetical protein